MIALESRAVARIPAFLAISVGLLAGCAVSTKRSTSLNPHTLVEVTYCHSPWGRLRIDRDGTANYMREGEPSLFAKLSSTEYYEVERLLVTAFEPLGELATGHQHSCMSGEALVIDAESVGRQAYVSSNQLLASSDVAALVELIASLGRKYFRFGESGDLTPRPDP
jgi:hypothetical protein